MLSTQAHDLASSGPYSRATAQGGIVLSKHEQTIEEILENLDEAGSLEIREYQRKLKEVTIADGLQLDTDHPYPVSLRPTVIDLAWADGLKVAGERLVTLFDQVLELYRHDPEIRLLYSAYEGVRDFILRAPHFRPLTRICRFDGLVSQDGRYLVLETNTDCPAHLFAAGQATRIWRSLPNPIVSRLDPPLTHAPQPILDQPDFFITELLSVCNNVLGRDPVEVRVVNYRGRFTAEADRVVKGFLALGINCEFVDLRELKRAGGRVTHRGAQLDLVYNKWDLRDLVNCPEAEPFLEAVARAEVLNVNPLVCQWLYADKLMLALLSDPKYNHNFSSADRALIQSHIPWTRALLSEMSTSKEGERIDLVQYVKARRTNLILKPTNATWGDGVLIGDLVDDASWRTSVENSIGKGFVVQEYVKGHIVMCPDPVTGKIESRIADLNTFIFGGKVVGFLSRANRSPIMSMYKGGVMLPVAIAEPLQAKI
ncbi:hypothetical protein ACVIJ6_006808 [Bradyrhizobium sp. USDA 4369]